METRSVQPASVSSKPGLGGCVYEDNAATTQHVHPGGTDWEMLACAFDESLLEFAHHNRCGGASIPIIKAIGKMDMRFGTSFGIKTAKQAVFFISRGSFH